MRFNQHIAAGQSTSTADKIKEHNLCQRTIVGLSTIIQFKPSMVNMTAEEWSTLVAESAEFGPLDSTIPRVQDVCELAAGLWWAFDGDLNQMFSIIQALPNGYVPFIMPPDFGTFAFFMDFYAFGTQEDYQTASGRWMNAVYQGNTRTHFWMRAFCRRLVQEYGWNHLFMAEIQGMAPFNCLPG